MSATLPPAPKARAFTLVELLVVIGIIAVLVAILLPALNSARAQANNIKCLSSLRQIGNSFMLYARDHKGCFPVARQDFPDNGWIGAPPINAGAAQNTRNFYWNDFLFPYFTTGKSNFQLASGALGDREFETLRQTVFWGCPAWDGWIGQGSVTRGRPPVSVFENGYSMNLYPTAKPGYPEDPTKFPPGHETQSRSRAITAADGSLAVGRWYKQSQWSSPSERMLLVDSNLWLLIVSPTDANGTISPQNAYRTVAAGPGANQIDRYRHGKRPPVVGGSPSGTFGTANVVTGGQADPGGGKTSYNILYADLHAANVRDIRDGYKAIRMRYP